MNKEILEKALVMMQENAGFTMRVVSTGRDDECGTPCCIAGHVLAAAGLPVMGAQDLLYKASDAAGLSWFESDELFVPVRRWGRDRNCRYDYGADPTQAEHITREHAVRCLRKFIDTGVIDWNGTAKEKGETE